MQSNIKFKIYFHLSWKKTHHLILIYHESLLLIFQVQMYKCYCFLLRNIVLWNIVTTVVLKEVTNGWIIIVVVSSLSNNINIMFNIFYTQFTRSFEFDKTKLF